MGKRDTLVTLSPEAVRALAQKWFLQGFASSGIGFNGHNYDREKHPALESLLISFFEGVYARGLAE